MKLMKKDDTNLHLMIDNKSRMFFSLWHVVVSYQPGKGMNVMTPFHPPVFFFILSFTYGDKDVTLPPLTRIASFL